MGSGDRIDTGPIPSSNITVLSNSVFMSPDQVNAELLDFIWGEPATSWQRDRTAAGAPVNL